MLEIGTLPPELVFPRPVLAEREVISPRRSTRRNESERKSQGPRHPFQNLTWPWLDGLNGGDWDEERVRLEAAAFRAADRYLGGVMLSNIVYTKLGPRPAILEPALVSMAHESGWISVTDDVAIRALAERIGAEREEVVRRVLRIKDRMGLLDGM
jgi:hypothetical protein